MSEAAVLLITSDYPPRVGGVARYYAGLKQAYQGIAVLTNVVGEYEPGVVRLSWSWLGWPRWLPLLWLVPRYRFHFGAKLLAAGELLPIGTALWCMHLAFAWRYLVFVHGLDVQLAQRSRWKRWLVRRLLGAAQLVVVNSRFTQVLAQRAGAPAEHIAIAYPCATLPPAGPGVVDELRAKYRLASGSVLLSVARLVPRKGIATVLRALPQVREVFPQLTYVVVGDGPEAEALKRLAATTDARVVFTGRVAEAELAGWYALADVFILIPEADEVDVEGFGTVYLEAQAAGKPVIAAHVGGVPEAVGEAGRYVASQAELVATLRELLARPQERERLGRLGEERVRTQFTWERQAAGLRKYLYD